ncbi:hypothetical protein [Pectinatus frisingensis]|uniref:hypothetical protein n=1 Tax=Pectinatus frisingensis TaxID=865 RepID=UPI001E2AD331|nr:hypothetical protein [Pectinatus frisingensis]
MEPPNTKIANREAENILFLKSDNRMIGCSIRASFFVKANNKIAHAPNNTTVNK